MKPSEISIPVNDSHITGNLQLVPDSGSLVIFAHGSGSSRFSTRNQFVANTLNKSQISTFLFDLLTEVIKLNEMAYAQLNCTKDLTIIPGATHLFE